MSNEEFYQESRRYLHRNLAEIWGRGIKLDWFLLGSTSAFIVSVFCIVAYLAALLVQAQQLPLAILLGAGFVVLAACVSYVGLYVGYKNLRETKKAQTVARGIADALSEREKPAREDLGSQ